MSDDKEPLEEIISVGGDIAGGVAGTAIGFLAGGPPGALGGAAAGPLISRSLRYVATELKQRFLGKREEARIGATLAYGISALEDRLGHGATIRVDGFFDASDGERSAADEVIEGTLLVAQRDHEERKLPFLGELLASIATNPSISRPQANHLVRQFESLSYRQLALLKVFASQKLPRDGDFRGQTQFPMPLVYLLAEALELYNRGMTNNGGDAMLGFTDLNPAKTRIQGVGAELYNYARLGKLNDPEVLTEIVTLLSAPVVSSQPAPSPPAP